MSANIRAMPRLIACLLSALCLLAPAQVQAWGPVGHRLVARLAEYQLDAGTRAEVRRLLALEQHRHLADVANWADELREHDPDLGRRSAKWHYVNIGEHDCRYDAALACKDGDCIVEAINAQAAILADRARPDTERLQALKFVVHFVGDVHQPMHAGYARDRGGNTVQVNYRGRGSNLHALWDSTLLGWRGMDERPYYWLLRITGGIRAAASGATTITPHAWAERSCAIAMQPGVYPPGARIDDAYVRRHLSIAEQQVRRGGARLAELLNATLG